MPREQESMKKYHASCHFCGGTFNQISTLSERIDKASESIVIPKKLWQILSAMDWEFLADNVSLDPEDPNDYWEEGMRGVLHDQLCDVREILEAMNVLP